MDAEANTAKVVDIPMPAMSMIHDMSITKNFVVIYDFPVTLSLMALATGSVSRFAGTQSMKRVSAHAKEWWSRKCYVASIELRLSSDECLRNRRGNVIVDICRYDRMFDGDINGPFGDSTPKLDLGRMSNAS